jgi:mycothiol synthase
VYPTDPDLDPAAPDLIPPPPGVALSRATWEDLDAVVDLYRQCELDRIGRATIRPEDVRYRWLAAGGFGDTLLVRADGMLVAYAEFHADVDPWTDVLDLFVEGRVHPGYTGRGLASFLLGRAADRARRAGLAAGAEEVALRTTVVDGDDRALRFYERRGFRPIRHFLELRLDLTAPPPAPTWPTGTRVRTFEDADRAAVWRVHQAAFRDVATHLPLSLDEWWESRAAEDPAFDPALWFLATTADEGIVAVCLARAATPEGADLGYVRDLAVLPDRRRRGLGMALLRTAFAAFRARGLTGAALEVDDVTLDGAVALYQAAGMRIIRRTDVLEQPIVVSPAPLRTGSR